MILFIEKVGLFLKVVSWSAVKFTPGLFYFVLFKFPWKLLKLIGLQSLDFNRFLGNIFTPRKSKGSVVKPGKPGHLGHWPPYVAPGKTDSRAPCPYLNAMANHNILPHDGKNIPLKALGDALIDCFNFSPTLVKDTVDSVAGLYGRDHICLSDLAAHNIVEHDASLVRHDAYFVEDQTIPAHDLINDMLDSASGPKTREHPEGYLTPADISRCMGLREARSRRDNPVFSLDVLHKFFGASNAALMYDVVGGDVRTLRTILHEERFPDGFETNMRQRFGYTMKDFHMRGMEIFLGMDAPKLPPYDMTTQEAVRRAATNASFS